MREALSVNENINQRMRSCSPQSGASIVQRGTERSNSQLQETLERQRTTADDLQNVLYSTKVATIFLDTRFRIRFFTPATRALFKCEFRATSDARSRNLHSLAADDALLGDAKLSSRVRRPSSENPWQTRSLVCCAGSCRTAPATRGRRCRHYL